MGRPRRAAVSSFGISGTNAHTIIEQAPQDEPVAAPRERTMTVPEVPWLLSAATPTALRGQAARLRAHVRGHAELAVDDIALTLATARAALEHRAAVVAGDRDQFLAGLAAIAEGREVPDSLVGAVPGQGRVAFLFTGQGAQRAGMGRELHEAFPVFAEAFDAVCARMDGQLDRPLRDVV
ncbi:CurL C-terminal domain-containing protein, partial [Streptomyces capparidis]